MKLEYSLKFKDYFLYNMWHQLQSIPNQLLYISVTLFISYSQFAEKGVLVGIILLIVVYVVLWSGQQVLNLLLLASSKNKPLLTAHEIEIREEAFVESTKYNKSFHYWPGIVKISSFPGVVAVYISAHAAHIIPNRAFESKDHKLKFIEEIKAKTASA